MKIQTRMLTQLITTTPQMAPCRRHSRKLSQRRAAAKGLRNWRAICSTLRANWVMIICTRFPIRVYFMHAEVAGSEGCGDMSEALLLLPVEEKPGTGLDTPILVRTGAYTQVPKQEHYCKVSRKVALQAKQSQINGWCFEEEQVASMRDVTTKVTRGELGAELHAHWLRDVVTSCSRKFVLINCFIMGTGEVGLAAVRAKASAEATTNDIRVCYFGHDPRKLFHEVARARCRTQVGKLYLEKKLTMHGHSPHAPLAVPGVKNLKMVQERLKAPLKRLQIDVDGRLVISTAAEVAASCPVVVTPDLLSFFEALRSEFPRPQGSGQPLAAAPAGGESSGGPEAAAKPTPSPDDAPADSQDPLTAGTVFLSQQRDLAGAPLGGCKGVPPSTRHPKHTQGHQHGLVLRDQKRRGKVRGPLGERVGREYQHPRRDLHRSRWLWWRIHFLEQRDIDGGRVTACVDVHSHQRAQERPAD